MRVAAFMSKRMFLVSEGDNINFEQSYVSPSSHHLDKLRGKIFEADNAVAQALYNTGASDREKLRRIAEADDR